MNKLTFFERPHSIAQNELKNGMNDHKNIIHPMFQSLLMETHHCAHNETEIYQFENLYICAIIIWHRSHCVHFLFLFLGVEPENPYVCESPQIVIQGKSE